jgi:hypothetical protein
MNTAELIHLESCVETITSYAKFVLIVFANLDAHTANNGYYDIMKIIDTFSRLKKQQKK